jgi:hypothetical protein
VFPGVFYRSGTSLTYSNRGGYGFTEETKDKLLEYYIVDADFRVEHAFNPGSYAEDDAGRIELYEEILAKE